MPRSRSRLTPDQLRELTLEQACTLISQAVYDASDLFEELASAGKVWGTAHHARMNIAVLAEREMKMRWSTPVVLARHKYLIAKSNYHMQPTGENEARMHAAEQELKRVGESGKESRGEYP